MEFRTLFATLIRRWWLVVPVFLLTFGSSLVFTVSQTRIYESSSTYLVKPSPGFADQLFTALNMVARQPEIAETYAEIATSRTVRQDADGALQLSAGEQRSIDTQARVVPGTTLIELTVRSPDPQLAHDYCAALGDALVGYLHDVSEVFELAAVDTPGVPSSPVLPNVPLNLLLGLAVAVALGVGVAFLYEIVRGAPARAPQRDIVDADSWAYNAGYFRLRLTEEMSRTRRTSSPLVLGLLNVNHGEALDAVPPRRRVEAMRRVGALLNTHVRPEDVVARIDDTTFAMLLVDSNEAEALEMIEGIRARLSIPALGASETGEPIRIHPAAGLIAYVGGTLTDEELLERARRALRDAELVPVGKTSAFSAGAASSG
jgi:capsular polysaccharide biosynthesis protein/GGDEF domain-containing protein